MKLARVLIIHDLVINQNHILLRVANCHPWWSARVDGAILIVQQTVRTSLLAEIEYHSKLMCAIENTEVQIFHAKKGVRQLNNQQK